MFYFLHRLVKWTFIVLHCAGLYWIWLQREALEPLYVWHDVYENGGIKNESTLHRVKGRAVAVNDGHTFQMIHQDGRSLSVRLAGLQLPEQPLSKEDIQLEKQRRTFLRDSVLQREVEVQVTYAVPGSMLGIVHINGTNLNTHFLTNGLARFNPDYIKALPRDEQYRFFAANRVREKSLEQNTALASLASTNQ